MTSALIIGTKQGVISAFKQNNHWSVAGHHLTDQPVTSIAISSGRVYAGTVHGMYRSSLDTSGKRDLQAVLTRLDWEPLRGEIGSAHIRCLAPHPETGGRILAGTEPAEIYVSQDGGDTWRSCPEVAELRERHGWYLPYSPEAGCVRGFAFHGRRAYAAVEDGCVLVSQDSGESWRLAEGSSGDPAHSPSPGSVHSDVHSIEVHSSSADRVLAPTGGGLFRSLDGGITWSNLYRCYTRAAWYDPDNSEHIIFGPADTVDRGGRIEMTQDGGKTWVDASEGLSAPWRTFMVERFVQVDGSLLAVLSNGQLALTHLDIGGWEFILPDVPFALSVEGIVDVE